MNVPGNSSSGRQSREPWNTGAGHFPARICRESPFTDGQRFGRMQTREVRMPFFSLPLVASCRKKCFASFPGKEGAPMGRWGAHVKDIAACLFFVVSWIKKIKKKSE